MSTENVMRAGRVGRTLIAFPKRGPARQPNGTGKTRIVIAHDHTLFREALRLLLDREKDFRVVGAANQPRDVLEIVRNVTPDVVLLGAPLSRAPGLEALRELAHRDERIYIVLITELLRNEEMVTAVELGARGVVLKDSSPEVLFEGIRAVMAGRCWLRNDAVTDLVGVLRERIPGFAAPPDEGQKPTYDLTTRELEVIRWVMTGLANKAIARQLSVSENTLKHHLANIFDKLGVSDRLELALFTVHHNLFATSPSIEGSGVSD